MADSFWHLQARRHTHFDTKIISMRYRRVVLYSIKVKTPSNCFLGSIWPHYSADRYFLKMHQKFTPRTPVDREFHDEFKNSSFFEIGQRVRRISSIHSRWVHADLYWICTKIKMPEIILSWKLMKICLVYLWVLTGTGNRMTTWHSKMIQLCQIWWIIIKFLNSRRLYHCHQLDSQDSHQVPESGSLVVQGP